MKIVSACLVGVPCRWNATAKEHDAIRVLVNEGKAIPVCPEQLGGLSTPRIPAEQVGDRVITQEGVDITDAYMRGALEALQVARLHGCTEAILKARSPACGCGQIYDGTFSQTLTEGDGVFTRLLKMHDIRVITEEDI